MRISVIVGNNWKKVKVHLTARYFFSKMHPCTYLKHIGRLFLFLYPKLTSKRKKTLAFFGSGLSKKEGRSIADMRSQTYFHCIKFW